MALSFTADVWPRRLVSVQARQNLADNFVTIDGCDIAFWRFATRLITDQVFINTTANSFLTGASGVPRGWGRTVTGILFTRNPEAAEALCNLTHLNSADGAVPDVANSLSLRIKYNTGVNTDNFRFVSKTFQPVAFGVGYGSGLGDYLSTLRGADAGRRGLFPVPWRLLLNAQNTGWTAANINASGMYTNFSNS